MPEETKPRMGIDHRELEEFRDQEWFASCFFDDERAGLVTGDNVIVLGYGAELNYQQAKVMADEHNRALKGRE